MGAQARGDTLVSPWTWEALDNEGDRITITISFNNATRAVTGGTAFRDSACTYKRLLIGTSADGNPDDTDKIVTVPSGATAIPVAWFTTFGLPTIESVMALQITAAP